MLATMNRTQGCGFSSGHVWLWELDYKESWALMIDAFQLWCWISKRNQSWIFIGRTDAEAETPILWPSDVKSWLIWKGPDAGKDWRQEEKGTTEDEMVGWHHRLNGHRFGWTPGVGDRQGSLVCCGSWDHKELDVTELNWKKYLLVMTKEIIKYVWIMQYNVMIKTKLRLRVHMDKHLNLSWANDKLC